MSFCCCISKVKFKNELALFFLDFLMLGLAAYSDRKFYRAIGPCAANSAP